MARAHNMPDIVGGEMTPPTSDKMDVIQVLRGVAALMVVAFHGVGYQMSVKEPGVTQLISSVGASGVDLFFMISGFIMVYATRNLQGGLYDTGEFLIKRMARIWPVYVVATLIYVPGMWLMGRYLGHIDIMTAPAKIVRSLLMIPTNFGSRGPYFGGSALHVGWTINYEAYFYLLFGLSLLFKRFRWIALSAIAAALLIALPATKSTPSLDAYVAYGFDSPLNFLTCPMLWEFFTGALIGKIYLSRFCLDTLSATLLSLFATAFVVWFLVTGVSNEMGYTGWAAPYALLLFALTIGSKSTNIKWPRSLVWVGNVSFSLYLVHPFVIHPIYQLLWERVLPGAIMNNVWFMFMLLVLSLALAAVSYRYLEAGLSEWLRVRLLRSYRERFGPKTESRPGGKIGATRTPIKTRS